MFLELYEKLKEFAQLNPNVRAVIVSYAILFGAIYWQHSIIQGLRKDSDTVSARVLEAMNKSEMHCQDLLNETRSRYQRRFDEQRESFQTLTDSLTIELSTLKVKLKRLNHKVEAQL